MTPENWAQVQDAPGYFISDLGRVLSTKSQDPHILKPLPAGRLDGYLKVWLSLGARGGGRAALIHQLVLLAFVGPMPAGMETMHLNGNGRDNRLANLAYGTHVQNMRDRVGHGTDPNASRSTCRHGHLYDGLNTRYRQRTAVDGAVRFTRVCRTCQSDASARSREKHIGVAPKAGAA